MQLVEAKPNPNGGIDRLFLLRGDAVRGPVAQIDGTGQLPAPSGSARLRIFHFNDLHNHLTELSGPTKGTHRFSQMVKRVRDARENSADPVLFLSIGDDHTGSMLDELVGWNPQDFVLDASYRAYSAAGVDATVLGNHEFDRGTELLVRGIRQDANFPLLSANVHGSKHLVAGQDYAPAAIAVLGGLRVGMLGLTTQVETRVGQKSDPTLAVASPVQVLENLLPALAPLVDVVLIMSHCGFGDGAHKSGKAAAMRDIGEADFALARAAARITSKPLLLLGAHTHTRLNENGFDAENRFDGIPIFQSECNGRFLGEINLNIAPDLPDGMELRNVCLHGIKPFDDTVGPGHPDAGSHEQPEDFDASFDAAFIAPSVALVRGVLNTEIARINTHALGFETTMLARYADESALANFVCDAICAQLEARGIGADFALMNGATLQAGMEPGTLTAGDWFDVMPYADEVFIVDVRGAELQQMLDSNAKRVLRPEEIPDTDYHGFLARGFFHTSHQIRYRVETGRAAKDARALQITYLGQPLGDLQNRTFKVVMSTYLALGGFGERWNGQPICGGVPGNLAGYDLRALPTENTNLVFRDEIAALLRDMGEVTEHAGGFCDGRLEIISDIDGTG